jgi:hypothetical protein
MVVKYGLSEEEMKDDFKQERCDVAGSIVWDKKGGDEIRAKLRIRKFDKLQEEKLAGTSTEDAIRLNSQATFILSTNRKI